MSADESIEIAVVVPCAVPAPISNVSVPSSKPIRKSTALPSNASIVSSVPASPIVIFGVVPVITTSPSTVNTLSAKVIRSVSSV